MAIYDLGTASLSANGEVTGVGTTWKAPLTLIRVGSTIVFKTEPVQIYTISEIISDTQINVYNPKSETVPVGTGYAILAHDGITVQGLAQDVAETLRYYQSQETEIADAVDFFTDFDWEEFKGTATKAEQDAASAELSKNAAKQSEDNAGSSAAAALASQNAAKTSEDNAKTSEDNAKQSEINAEQWAQSVNADNLLTKSGSLAGLADLPASRTNLGLGEADNVTHQSLRLKRNGNPYISLTNNAIESSSRRNNMSLELNDDGVVRLYRRANDGIGPYNRLNFPQIDAADDSETSLGLKGGLLWDGGQEVGDLNFAEQGWSRVSGRVSNTPFVRHSYGSCFSYCPQGLREGNLPGSYNPKDVWWYQVFHSTDNKTYSRVNINQGEWEPWAEYTMSSVSDERLKNVIGSLNVEGALDNINRMDFKLFRFKNESNPNKEPTVRRGVISQQIRGIDKEYTKLIGGYYHLDRTPMLLDGLAAIKALRARDEANKAEIAELKASVEELKSIIESIISK